MNHDASRVWSRYEMAAMAGDVRCCYEENPGASRCVSRKNPLQILRVNYVEN